MTSALLPMVAWAGAGIAVLMTAVFLFARAVRNYSVVDAAWAYKFTPLVVWYALATPGVSARKAIVVALVAAWSLRLGTHLARRIWRAHPVEDRRYHALRQAWAPRLQARMFGFFQLQGVFSLLLSTPLLLAAANPNPFPGWLELAGMLLVLAGFAGEAVADSQLQRFKARTAGAGRVCRAGLWRYSRHPNYFFEWVVWLGFGVIALAAPGGWLGLGAPAAMLYLLLRVTGIPATEEAAVTAKGEAYREYQRTTSAFFPRPPRAVPPLRS
jgi:steroid 5-alpha reductase family enzyme